MRSMRTPYTGRADVGGVACNVTIENVDTGKWIGDIDDSGPGERFEPGAVSVTLIEQPRPGWRAPAIAEQLPNGSRRLVGTGVFRSTRNENANRAAFRMWAATEGV